MKHKNIKKRRGIYQSGFHVLGLDDVKIIDLQNGGLDDVNEFNCDMYNFGEMDDLPDSDRAMIGREKRCKEYREY